MIIGIAGKYCAGKDTALRVVLNYGFSEINMDRIGHAVLDQKQRELAAAFGPAILDSEGRVDRGILGQLVFEDREKLALLESIVHPAMVAETKRIIASDKGRRVINAPLLFKMGLDTLCDFIICLKAPFLTRLKRALDRDGLPLGQILERFRAQSKICPKNPKKDVDIYYISNFGSRKRLEAKISRLMHAKTNVTLG